MSQTGTIARGSDARGSALQFYMAALRALREGGVEFMVGGAYALERYTGIDRDTRDLDIFVRPADCPRTLATLSEAGYHTALPFPHWLAKARCDEHVLDVIFSSGNGVSTVDDEWFEHAVPADVLGVAVLLTPVEEMIWSKAFIMERERYDGADVAHLINARGHDLDWDRLVRRFGAHWRVLLSHLVLFGFAYPGQRGVVPTRILAGLLDRLDAEGPPRARDRRLCQGTLLSREQYLPDLDARGYEDARLFPRGAMTAHDIRRWTEAIDRRPPVGSPPDDAHRRRR